MDVNFHPLSVFTHAVKRSPDILPVLMSHDLYHYIINNPLHFIEQDVKAHKNVNAYQYFV